MSILIHIPGAIDQRQMGIRKNRAVLGEEVAGAGEGVNGEEVSHEEEGLY